MDNILYYIKMNINIILYYILKTININNELNTISFLIRHIQ